MATSSQQAGPIGFSNVLRVKPKEWGWLGHNEADYMVGEVLREHAAPTCMADDQDQDEPQEPLPWQIGTAQ
jgi:hypothetical protein